MLCNPSGISKKYHGGAPPARGKAKAPKEKKPDPYGGTIRIKTVKIRAPAFSNEEDDMVEALAVSVLFDGRPYEDSSRDVSTMKEILYEYTRGATIKFIRPADGGPFHALYPMPNVIVAKELAAVILKRLPQAFRPGFTVDDIWVAPEIANKAAPKMTILVSDMKVYGLSGNVAPKSIFVVMNENVKVLNSKAHYTFPLLSFNTFTDLSTADDMYEALITLYTDEYLVMLKNFYTHHGFDVEVVEELVGVEELVDDN